jgi:hypothetical protein
VIQPNHSRLANSAPAAAILASVLAALAFLAVVLLRFPPDRYAIYPVCPIYYYLHLQCPGCGTTRALAALLHGHIAEAFHLNPFTTLLLPLVVAYMAHHIWKQRNNIQTISWPNPPRHAVYALLGTAAIFTVSRNILS